MKYEKLNLEFTTTSYSDLRAHMDKIARLPGEIGDQFYQTLSSLLKLSQAKYFQNPPSLKASNEMPGPSARLVPAPHPMPAVSSPNKLEVRSTPEPILLEFGRENMLKNHRQNRSCEAHRR